MKTRTLIVLTLVLPFAARDARGQQSQQSTQACLTASEEGQKMRDERKFKKAREQFLLCMKETCPGIVKRDCAEWFNQVEGAMSSVVLSAKVCGKDVFEAKVSIDGKAVTERLDGKSLPIDAGPHKFKFEVRDKKSGEMKAHEEDALVSEGQKNKIVNGSFESPVVDCGGPAVPVAPPSTSKERSSPVGPVILGSAGLVALGIGVVIDLKGFGEYDDKKTALERTCLVNGQKVCTKDQVDTELDPPKTTMLIGEIMMGAGIIAVGAATIWYFTSASSEPNKTSSMRIPAHTLPQKFSATPLPGGGVFGLSGQF